MVSRSDLTLLLSRFFLLFRYLGSQQQQLQPVWLTSKSGVHKRIRLPSQAVGLCAFCLILFVLDPSAFGQCSRQRGESGPGGAEMYGANSIASFGGQQGYGLVGNNAYGGARNAGFAAGGNPQVFARAMLQVQLAQRQNQILQQQLLVMRRQILDMKRENQRLLARLNSPSEDPASSDSVTLPELATLATDEEPGENVSKFVRLERQTKQ